MGNQDPKPLPVAKPDFEAMQRQHRIMQGLNDNFQRKKITACDNKYKYFEMGLISKREKTFINMVAKHSAFEKLRLQGTISSDFDWGYLKSPTQVDSLRGTTTWIRKGEAWVPEGSSCKPFTARTFTIKLIGLGSIFSPESRPMFQLVYSPSKDLLPSLAVFPDLSTKGKFRKKLSNVSMKVPTGTCEFRLSFGVLESSR